MASYFDRTRSLIDRGHAHEALKLLETGVAGDDPEALFCFGVWHLVGTNVPRDLVTARSLLRRAACLGHEDAALFEVALTANGSGDQSNWPRARQLLAKVAETSITARQHMAMLENMLLDSEGYPRNHFPFEVLSQSPLVHRYRNFLTRDECAHLAMSAKDILEPTTVFDAVSGRQIRHPVRISSGAVIGPTREDLVISTINRRFAAISGSNIDQGESLSILHYAVGEQYRPHADYLTGTKNQRIKTIIVYLNDGYDGGGTYFTANHHTVIGKAGDAIMFDNVLPDGRPNPLSQHAGLPVTSGSKWVATRWIRQNAFDPWTDA